MQLHLGLLKCMLASENTKITITCSYCSRKFSSTGQNLQQKNKLKTDLWTVPSSFYTRARRHEQGSLLHNRSLCRHATLCSSSSRGGELCDDTKNGC